MDKTLRTLADADIASAPALSRRTVLTSLSLGAGLAAAATVLGGVTVRAQQTPPSEPKPKRRDPCRDSDHGPSDTDGCGRPPIS
jgi:hypothetical protein